MLLLSCIDENYNFSKPVDTMYLNRVDRALINSEVKRLGTLVSSDDVILMTEDAFGNPVCDTVQLINNNVVDISPLTAVILTRLRQCYPVFQASVQETSTSEIEARDLDTDAVILRLEGNPHYIYNYVYGVMENTTISYSSRIAQLSELYNALIGFSIMTDNTDKRSGLLTRLTLQSDIAFWQQLFYTDWIHRTLAAPNAIGVADVEVTKKELKGMGFYGFVNPLKMYNDFIGSRVNRKVELNVSDEVLNFLGKVVMSGGAVV